MAVVSWSASPNPAARITPMIWVHPPTFVRAREEQTPRLAATAASNEMSRRAPQERVLFLWRLLYGDYAKTPMDAITTGINGSRQRDWFIEFWQRLAATRVAPSLIVLDDEGDMTGWSVMGDWGDQRVEKMQAILNHPRCPEEIRKFKAEDFRTPGQADYAWNAWTYARKQEAHKAVVFDPFKAAFGQVVPHLNYGEFRFAEPVTDINGHPFIQDIPIGGDLNSPVVYNWGVGNKFRNGPKKAVRWNSLIDGLNLVRSCLRQSPQIWPWVTNPLWCGDHVQIDKLTAGQRFAARWWWMTAMLHMALNGVRDFVYWNIGPPAEDAYARSIFDYCTALNAPKLDLPLIPMDADEIQTGNLRTTYQQFMELEKLPD